MNKGILYILLSGLCFMFVNIFVKVLSLGPAQSIFTDIQKYPIPEIVLFRSIISFVMSYIIIKKRGLPIFGVNKKWLLIRGIFGTIALTTFFYTLDHLPIAVATTVQYLSPLFTVVIAIFLLKETVKPIQWLFFGIAFLGVFTIGISKFIEKSDGLAVINPWWVLAGIGSAVSAGVAYNAIVKCKATDQPINIVIYFPMVAIPIMSVLCFFEFVLPIGKEWFILLIIGVFTQFAQLLMTKALHEEATATVTPFKYFGSIYAVFVGMFLFGEFISIYAYIGITLILSGVLGNTLVRKRKRRVSSTF